MNTLFRVWCYVMELSFHISKCFLDDQHVCECVLVCTSVDPSIGNMSVLKGSMSSRSVFSPPADTSSGLKWCSSSAHVNGAPKRY